MFRSYRIMAVRFSRVASTCRARRPESATVKRVSRAVSVRVSAAAKSLLEGAQHLEIA